MKATGILSALIFAHAVFAQATDSSSVVPTDSPTVGAASSTPISVSSTDAATSTPVPVSSTASASSGTRTGTKSNSAPASTGTATTSAGNPAPTASIWESGTKTLTSNNGNPLIPSDISANCSTFLTKLNTDTDLSKCMTPMLNAAAQFTTSGSGALSAVTKTLNNLCSTNACPVSMIRSKLTDFNNACNQDFDNEAVLRDYDSLYTLVAFKSAICTKDTNTQAYCALGSGSAGSKRSVSKANDALYARDHLVNTYVKRGASETVFVVNSETFSDNYIPFLFASPDMNAGELCTPCTQQVLSKYVAFESATPYAVGLANSPLLGKQAQLWSAVKDKCPGDFMSTIANAAGTPDASFNGASHVIAGSTLTAFAGALAALVALV